MKITRLGAGLVLVLTVGMSACGGSDGVAGKVLDGGGGTAAPSGGDLGTIPAGLPGVSADCTELYNKYITALGSMASGGSDDASQVFAGLESAMPDELKDEAKTLATAWAAFAEVMKKYENDPTKAIADPDAAAAMAALNSEEVTNASNAIGDYFNDTCGQS